jgi:hypothetical protein
MACLQSEVENITVNRGFFIPVCHRSYWLGYKAQFWGRWPSLDANVPSNGSNVYRNFGRFPIAEPDGRRVPELCTVANSSETGAGSSYGWSDTDCNRGTYTYICRIIRE